MPDEPNATPTPPPVPTPPPGPDPSSPEIPLPSATVPPSSDAGEEANPSGGGPLATGPDEPSEATRPRRVSRWVWVGLGLLVVLPTFALFVEGEWEAFFFAGWNPAPFAVLCVLAYLGLDRPWARKLSYVWLGFLLVGGVGVDLFSTYLGLVGEGSDAAEAFAAPDLNQTLQILTVGGIAAIAALTVFLPRFGAFRRCSEWLGCDREWTSVRRLALAGVVSLTAVAFVPLLVVGQPPLLLEVQRAVEESRSLSDGRSAGGLLREELYGLAWVLVSAAFAVGYGIRRTGAETLERLGLRRPTRRHYLVAAVATGVILGFAHGLDLGIGWVWERCGWPTTDEEAFLELFDYALSPTGALVIGVVAGLGEEVAVRGILQPRLGILWSNLFFTALHAYQYHWDALLSVFVTGLFLGLLRQRTDTTTSAFVHGSYDFVLIMSEVLAPTP